MFNQAAAKKAAKQEGGPRGSCLGPGTLPSSIWAREKNWEPGREKFGTRREKSLGPGERKLWDPAREKGTWREKNLGPGEKIWDPTGENA